MSEQEFDRLISEAVDTVLETMFFSAPLGPAQPETGAEVFEARLGFRGRPSGTLSVRLSRASARLLAAGFLGEDEDRLTDAQPGQAVCELANMVCGWLVSKLEREQSFELASPALVPAGGEDSVSNSPAARQSFELEDGILTVTLHLGTAA